jgi:hypothetical protein
LVGVEPAHVCGPDLKLQLGVRISILSVALRRRESAMRSASWVAMCFLCVWACSDVITEAVSEDQFSWR